MIFLPVFRAILLASVSFASLQIVRIQDRHLSRDQADNTAGSRSIMDGFGVQRSHPGSWWRSAPPMMEYRVLPKPANRISSLGFIKVDNTFYWIGENKTSGTDFQSITCYSSTVSSSPSPISFLRLTEIGPSSMDIRKQFIVTPEQWRPWP